MQNRYKSCRWPFSPLGEGQVHFMLKRECASTKSLIGFILRECDLGSLGADLVSLNLVV